MEFCGLPLLAWTIRQVESVADRGVFVSTDSPAIAQVAHSFGASVVRRPDALATDSAIGDEAMIHALQELQLAESDYVLMPQVTSPLRTVSQVRGFTQMLESGDWDSVFSAVRIDDICVWEAAELGMKALTYDPDGRQNRQSRPRRFVENGSLYGTRIGAYLEYRNRLAGRYGVFEMPRWTLPEIDEPDDLRICSALMCEFVMEEDADG